MTISVCLTFDVDFEFLWLETFGTRNLSDLSRGEYGRRVGLPRIRRLLRERGIPATFFVPGRVAESFPDVVRALVQEGHEVAAHGYRHERWATLDPEAEREALRRSRAMLEAVTGEVVLGFRSPGWELTEHTPALLLETGYRYDSSLMGHDLHPYRLRQGARYPDTGPITEGVETDIVEFPVSWELDDFPYFARTETRHGLQDPRVVEAIWWQEFSYAAGEPDAVFTLTMHPQVIGRGPRIEMLGRLLDRMAATPGVRFRRLSDELHHPSLGSR